MWFYVERILIPQQVRDATAHNRPRGNLSDLYPRWLGARELLRRGGRPFRTQMTGEIQDGYYGRRIEPARPDDPKDEQGFAYPAYVLFLLAPSIDLPFEVIQKGFRWFLIVLAGATVLLWLYVLGWKPAPGTALILIFL